MKSLFSLLTLSLILATPAVAKKLNFNSADRKLLSSLSINKIKAPLTSGNQYADNIEAAEFGKKLFFDRRLSANKAISCAHCHNPSLYFTDGLKVSQGIGATRRNSPSILFSAWSPWQYWDGRKDSMWSQALSPLEDPKEHGLKRAGLSKLIKKYYSKEYKEVFGSEAKTNDNHVFANIGKALMAYQLKLKSLPSRFDQFVELVSKRKNKEAQKIFTYEEIAGLKLFAGKANCISCHNGPHLTNFEFHNVGAPEADETKVDLGRWDGVKKLEKDEFTCLSEYSSTPKDKCLEMKFLKTSGQELVGAFKTPSLRNVEKTAPYMHSGQFATLEEVVEHYNKPKPPFYDREQHPSRPHFDIFPLRLTDEEKRHLVAFLKTLTSPKPQDDSWWGL